MLAEKDCSGDLHYICGIPYQGIPFATHFCVDHGLRMLLMRIEKKKYGTCNRLEISFKMGDDVMLIVDVLMTAGTNVVFNVTIVSLIQR